ncbi:DNA binding protein [Arthrobacter phage VroomVroom]|uniref:DNA binding protein n=1 Tax=Arthrobacter phage VroomVroom TaxID=3049371 RepID=A0AA49FAD9_9CAUD|nr:DNA binding protein [Arthrobacter phage VroomVroom]
MENFTTILDTVYNTNINTRYETDAEEQAVIAAAQAGDDDAKMALVYAYGFALRAAAGKVAKKGEQTPEEADDLRMDLLVTFLEAIGKFDVARHQRLAAVLSFDLKKAVGAAATSATDMKVPARTLSRYFEVLRKAEAQGVDPLDLCRDRSNKTGMSPKSFLATQDALRSVEKVGGTEDDDASALSWENLTVHPLHYDRSEEAEEDALLVEAAFGSVDDLEEDVVRLAYGFTEPNTFSDDAIGERLGFSRSKTQRIHQGALGKMRGALGVA